MTQPKILGRNCSQVVECSSPDCLCLLNKHIPRCISHFNTLVIMNDSIMDPSSRTYKSRLLVCSIGDVDIIKRRKGQIYRCSVKEGLG